MSDGSEYSYTFLLGWLHADLEPVTWTLYPVCFA